MGLRNALLIMIPVSVLTAASAAGQNYGDHPHMWGWGWGETNWKSRCSNLDSHHLAGRIPREGPPLVTTKRLLGFFLVWTAFSIALAGSAAAQKQVRFQIRNASGASLNIRVYDEVCRQTVFSGRLHSRAWRPIAVCHDRQRRGHIVVSDRFGEQRSYRIRQNQVLSLRARYGSGGLGR